MNKIFLFDMDGTLTSPRRKISFEMIRALKDLSNLGKIGIVTGSDYNYVVEQCTSMFEVGGVPADRVELFPCNGTKHYKWGGSSFKKIHDVDMIEAIGIENYQTLIQNLFSFQLMISVKHPLPYTGTFFDYRGSMLNWCPIGRKASKSQREEWIKADSEENIRSYFLKEINNVVNKRNLKLSVALGGSTSFDIFPEGWDKTYVLNHLEAYSDIDFFGDKCSPSGNDYQLYELLKDGKGTQGYEVKDSKHTIEIINSIITRGNSS
tara:strand:- start:2199 stop:2990 length:792 start_codon:yes stop_codon:yes gene_type:complete